MAGAKQSQSYYLHVDGDNFFVGCELLKRPDLIGKSVIVGQDRGIAVAMSREAKSIGITRGMPIFKIKKQFPQTVILSHTFGLYREVSDKMYDLLMSYVEEVERYSVDECFAKVKNSDLKYFGGAEKLITEIQAEIKKTIGVSYSIGIGRTKALAKTASKLEKPGGSVALLTMKAEEEALKNSTIDDIWGIGFRTLPKFKNMGIKNAYDFIQMPDEMVLKYFGRTHLELKRELAGEQIYELHFDEDPRDQKSIQSTATFKPSSSDKDVIWAEFSENVEEACERARKLNLVSNKVGFFVKNTEFKHHYMELKLPLYSADPGYVLNIIEKEFPGILVRGEKIRSTGITLFNLCKVELVQRDLFQNQDNRLKREKVEEAADKIRKKFGRDALKRATSVKSRKS